MTTFSLGVCNIGVLKSLNRKPRGSVSRMVPRNGSVFLSFPSRSKYPNMKHIPQTVITMPNRENISYSMFGYHGPRGVLLLSARRHFAEASARVRSCDPAHAPEPLYYTISDCIILYHDILCYYPLLYHTRLYYRQYYTTILYHIPTIPYYTRL